MGLLAPLFIAGLLAVAIPIVVHLVHRERKEPLAFPSLMFLRRVPFRSAKRQRIRYWSLFLLRVAALILIATAFARPWVRRELSAAGGAAAGKDVVVLVDRSYSMAAGDVWSRAERAARAAVEDAGETDRIAVIGFGEQAELLARLDDARSTAQAAVQRIQPGSDVTRYAPAFKLAGSVLANSRGPAEIVIITDRQRSGWRNLEQVAVPPNTTVTVVDVRAGSLNNVAITDAQLARSRFAGRDRVVPSARLINRGDRDVTVPVQLRLGERIQQTRNVMVRAHGTTQVAFDAMFASSLVGEMRVDRADDIAADNAVYFTTAASSVPSVRIVSGSTDASYYFENALTAGGAGSFALHRGSAQLGGADLRNIDVLVFLEAGLPAGQAAEQLAEFVRQGGGLVIAGATTARNELSALRSGVVQNREQNPVSLVSIDALHPIFEPFRASGAGQFAGARFSRFARGTAEDEAQVVARFDDGSPALLERRHGRGRILHWTSGFSRASGDFVLQPAFVPFVQQLVKHAVAGNQAQKAYTIGHVIDVNAFAPGDRDAVVLSPSGQRTRAQAGAPARTLRASEAGIYQIRGVGEGAATQVVAVNVDIAESDITPIGAEAFNDAITTRAQNAAGVPAAVRPQDREQQQRLWWYLLLIAFAFLAIETVFANRISTAWRT